MSADQWLLFLPAAALVALSPGAGNLLALSNGMRSGVGPAIFALAGRFTAFAAMILMVMLGLGAILAASETAFHVVKWAGVAYLAYLGLRMWRSRDRSISAEPRQDRAIARWRLAKREFWVAMTNPKAVLLFTAFLPQFVDVHRPLYTQFCLLGAAYIAIEFLAATGYALLGSRIRRLRLSDRGHRWINRATGGMMLGAAAWLATAKRA